MSPTRSPKPPSTVGFNVASVRARLSRGIPAPVKNLGLLMIVMALGLGSFLGGSRLVSPPLAAQTRPAFGTPHPCDATAPVSAKYITGALRLGFCWNGKGIDGTQVGLSYAIVKIDTNFTYRYDVFPSVAWPRPNRKGLTYYELAPVSVLPGAHTVSLQLASPAGEGPWSNPVTFTVPLAAKPVGPDLIRVLP